MVSIIKSETARVNIEIEQGEDFNKVITYKVGGIVQNLNNFTARMHIREYVGSSTAIDTLTTENARIVLGGGNGTITLVFTDTITAAYTLDTMYYDFELINASGSVQKLMKGKIILYKEVTI